MSTLEVATSADQYLHNNTDTKITLLAYRMDYVVNIGSLMNIAPAYSQISFPVTP
jgi:hypothetical protein